MARLYVRSRHFDNSQATYFWSHSDHAWSCLSGATVYTQEEIDSFHKLVLDDRDHGYVKNRNSGADIYVPAEGEWEPLPDMCKLKTVDEWLAEV